MSNNADELSNEAETTPDDAGQETPAVVRTGPLSEAKLFGRQTPPASADPAPPPPSPPDSAAAPTGKTSHLGLRACCAGLRAADCRQACSRR